MAGTAALKQDIPSKKDNGFTSYQKVVIAILAFLQFTIILDFMIISPLGAILMPALKITTTQFGLVVSVYAFSAGASGILAAGFADKYDRKRFLLFFYTGFLIGTLLCALAPNYYFLLAARLITGVFGGVIGSAIFAIITDLFPFHMRGRVMGFVQTSFAASQILGIPAGLFFSNHWGWHSPFLMIVVLGVLAGGFIWYYLKPIDEHLKHSHDNNPLQHLVATVTNRRYAVGFVATALLSIGGFMLMPFGSAFSVNNMKISFSDLPLLYLATGLSAMFIGPFVGRLSDKFGPMKTFIGGTTLTIVMVVIYTNLEATPLWLAIIINSILFLGIFSRMIPSQALMSAVPAPASRGAFMAISSSLQQIAGGLGAVVAGLVVVESADGRLEHFDTLGYVMVGMCLVTLVLIYRVYRMVKQDRN